MFYTNLSLVIPFISVSEKNVMLEMKVTRYEDNVLHNVYGKKTVLHFIT